MATPEVQVQVEYVQVAVVQVNAKHATVKAITTMRQATIQANQTKPEPLARYAEEPAIAVLVMGKEVSDNPNLGYTSKNTSNQVGFFFTFPPYQFFWKSGIDSLAYTPKSR